MRYQVAHDLRNFPSALMFHQMSQQRFAKANLIPAERIERSIYLIRGHKVMLDADLAALYGVTTGNLNLAVRRNPDRFHEAR